MAKADTAKGGADTEPQMNGQHEAEQPSAKEPVIVQPMQFGPIKPIEGDEPVSNLDLLMDVRVRVAVELGRTSMSIRQVTGLTRGAVIELDKLAGEAVDVYVNDTMIARGEVVVVGEKFGVRVTEVVSSNHALGLGAMH